jgi:hypothetical protein
MIYLKIVAIKGVFSGNYYPTIGGRNQGEDKNQTY